MSEHDAVKDPAITIKKYANRRLYNTESSSYVTLEHLAQMVKNGVNFVAVDAKTGEDITRSVLTQIIVEEESKGPNLLPIGFLRQLIGLYGNNMQWAVPNYLEGSLQIFSRNQEKMHEYMQSTLTGSFPFGEAIEQISKQQFTMIERMFRVFTPISENTYNPANSEDKSQDELKRTIRELELRLSEMRNQLALNGSQPQGRPMED